MGFLKRIRESLQNPISPSNRSANSSTEKNHASSVGLPPFRSALPPGRMKMTDVIKGPGCAIPHEPGTYRHVDKKTKTIVYVGQSNDLRVRQQQHARSGRLDTATHAVQYRVARPDATKDDLCRTEQCHIERHKPIGNKTKGGNGRR